MSSSGQQRRDGRGFSMLEILMAVTIVMLGLLPVMNLATAGLRETSMTREDIMARNSALDLLERFCGESSDVLEAVGEPALTDDEAEKVLSRDAVLGAAGGAGTAALVAQIGEKLSVKRRVEFERDGGGKPGLHRLTVRLTFESRNRGKRTIAMHRLFFRPAVASTVAATPTTGSTVL